MGRPPIGVLGSFSFLVQEAIEALRGEYSAWGAGTIRQHLLSKGRFSSTDLPSISRIAAFLKAKGHTHGYDRQRRLPNPDFVAPTRNHQTWQIDDQGVEFYKGVGYIRMINIKDVFNHIHVGGFPVLVQTKNHSPSTSDYQCALRLAFARFGMPEHIQSDNGSVFHDTSTMSPFPTTFHLWLTALGIRFSFARSRTPTDQAAIERTHRTLFNQIKRATPFKNWQHLHEWVQERIEQLNEALICQTIKDSPLKAFPQAIHSKRYYIPQNELELLDLDRIWTFLSHCEWYRKVAKNHVLSLGGQLYAIKEAKPQQQLRITFDEKGKILAFHDGKELIVQKNITGITKQKIAGQDNINFKMPGAQLELPFSWQSIKMSTTLRDNN
jgi:transposase InsO family protein